MWLSLSDRSATLLALAALSGTRRLLRMRSTAEHPLSARPEKAKVQFQILTAAVAHISRLLAPNPTCFGETPRFRRLPAACCAGYLIIGGFHPGQTSTQRWWLPNHRNWAEPHRRQEHAYLWPAKRAPADAAYRYPSRG